jgi:hypothetical protein
MPIDFEKYLKNSAHFADVMNTHREATARIIFVFLETLVQKGHLEPGEVLGTLKALENIGAPSIRGEVSHLTKLVREQINLKR